jgi:ElaB/YqjD/DUF883 family membrane-anchored ribosome-binding protein
VDNPIEGERERLQEAAANSAEELKDAVGELTAAAQTQANGMIETGRWIWLGAGLIVGLLVGFRAERKAVFERSSDD